MSDEPDPRWPLKIEGNLREYLRIVARGHVEGSDDADDEERDDVWRKLTKEEQDTANAIVVGVFGEWL